MAQYKRILLKLSGESLMGGKQYGIDEVRLNEYATQIKEIAEMGVQIGIVIGGGNIFRPSATASSGVGSSVRGRFAFTSMRRLSERSVSAPPSYSRASKAVGGAMRA